MVSTLVLDVPGMGKLLVYLVGMETLGTYTASLSIFQSLMNAKAWGKIFTDRLERIRRYLKNKYDAIHHVGTEMFPTITMKNFSDNGRSKCVSTVVWSEMQKTRKTGRTLGSYITMLVSHWLPVAGDSQICLLSHLTIVNDALCVKTWLDQLLLSSEKCEVKGTVCYFLQI